jgi:hypothetical protein
MKKRSNRAFWSRFERFFMKFWYAVSHFFVLLVVSLDGLGGILPEIRGGGLSLKGLMKVLNGVDLLISRFDLSFLAGCDLGVGEGDGGVLVGDALGESHDALQDPGVGILDGRLVESGVFGWKLVEDHLESIEATSFEFELGKLFEDDLLGLLASKLGQLRLGGGRSFFDLDFNFSLKNS